MYKRQGVHWAGKRKKGSKHLKCGFRVEYMKEVGQKQKRRSSLERVTVKKDLVSIIERSKIKFVGHVLRTVTSFVTSQREESLGKSGRALSGVSYFSDLLSK